MEPHPSLVTAMSTMGASSTVVSLLFTSPVSSAHVCHSANIPTHMRWLKCSQNSVIACSPFAPSSLRLSLSHAGNRASPEPQRRRCFRARSCHGFRELVRVRLFDIMEKETLLAEAGTLARITGCLRPRSRWSEACHAGHRLAECCQILEESTWRWVVRTCDILVSV